MPFNEALFWVGLTVAGTGLYFLFAGEGRRWSAVALTVGGAVAVAYSVYVHDHPSIPHPAAWVVLLVVTWLAIALNIYDRRRTIRVVPEPPLDVEAAMRRKRVRTEQIKILQRLYDTGRHAIGELCIAVDGIAGELRQQPPDAMKRFAANALLQCRTHIDHAVRATLSKRVDSDSDTPIAPYLEAWGHLFSQYQMLVFLASEGYRALDVDPWATDTYRAGEHQTRCSYL